MCSAVSQEETSCHTMLKQGDLPKVLLAEINIVFLLIFHVMWFPNNIGTSISYSGPLYFISVQREIQVWNCLMSAGQDYDGFW